MGDVDPIEVLAAECRVFTRYLLDADTPSEVMAAYQRAHEVSAVAPRRASRPLDRALLRVALLGPGFTRAADGYAAAFAKASVLRRKLVLLVAILESRQHTAAVLDTAAPGSRAAWVFAVGLRVATCALLVSLVMLLIAPLYAWYSLMDAYGA
jgi:hypothetical protein